MSQVNEIKAASDLVQIIGERIELKRSGSSHKGLCPFHSESSPSFFVNPQMQYYKCFGCGESGDVIEFLQKYEGMTFLEALKFLADEAGIELKSYQKSGADHKREKLLEILDLAGRYYHYLLTEHELGEPGRAYLKERKILKDSIKRFQLGFAPEGWGNLHRYLVKKKKYDEQLVLETGLIIKARSGRFYDRFRGRLVFPLKNHRGQVVGFSGRIIVPDDKSPKYINTPETDVYHKSKTLFGYSELYQQIREKKELIVVEGEFDVVSSAQAHVKHICAIKGSALTEDQVKLMNRTVDKVIVCLDADSAGVKAAKRAIELINETDLELRLIDLSQVEEQTQIKDVDDLAREHPKKWREVSGQTISPYDFLMNVSFREHDQSSAGGKRQIIDELAPVFSQIPHEVEKDFYIRKLADRLKVKPSLVASDITKFGTQGPDYRNQSQASPENDWSETPHQTRLEVYLLFLVLHSKDQQAQARALELSKYQLQLVGAKQVLDQIEKMQEYSLDKLAANLSDDLKRGVMEWYEQPEFHQGFDKQDLLTEWTKSMTKFKRLDSSNKMQELNQKIEKLEESSNLTAKQQDQLEEYLQEIVRLSHQLKLS